MSAGAGEVTSQRRGRGPSRRKQQAVLDAARTLFVREGYAGTSIEEVAALAGVAKQTIYTHFSDKLRLFTELIEVDIAHSRSAAHPLTETMTASNDLGRDLRVFARAHLADVMQPELLRMRRMLIGEAERFPELAGAWYEAGPMRSCALFASWFTELHHQGRLRTPSPALAAEHFNWLILSIPLNRAMSIPDTGQIYTSAELDHYADEGVRVFLAAYGPAQAAPAEGHTPHAGQ